MRKYQISPNGETLYKITEQYSASTKVTNNKQRRRGSHRLEGNREIG